MSWIQYLKEGDEVVFNPKNLNPLSIYNKYKGQKIKVTHVKRFNGSSIVKFKLDNNHEIEFTTGIHIDPLNHEMSIINNTNNNK